MTKYSWPLPGEGATAQDLLATEIVNAIPGLKGYSLDARRDATIAELVSAGGAAGLASFASKTVNAAAYTGATKEAQITAAIADAVGRNYLYVFVPATMIPYNASLVTFNNAVRLIREGGNPLLNDVRAYGAWGDGVTDDTVPIQAAITSAQGSPIGVVYCPRPSISYLITQVLISASNLSFLSEPGTKFLRTATGVNNAGMIEANGTVPGPTTTLSVSAAIAATSLTVVSSTGFTAGDFIEIESSLTLGGLTYNYEVNRVASTGAGAINVQWALRNAYSTSAQTISVRKIGPLTGILIQGGDWTGAGGTFGDIVRLVHCINPIVADVTVRSHGQQGIIGRQLFRGSISRCESIDATSANAHGIALYTCEGCVVEDCTARDGDFNGVDLGAGSMYNLVHNCRTLNSVDVGFVCGHGEHGHHNVIRDCTSVRCGNGGFQFGDPAYESDEDNTIINCRDVGTTNVGFKVVSANGKVSTRNKFINCQSINNSSHGFSTDTLSTDNEFIECTGQNNAQHGISIQARSRVSGGHFDGNTFNGIRVTSATAADTVLDGVSAKGNTLENIVITTSAARTIVRNAVVENSGATKPGIQVTSSTDVRIVEPICRNNATYGVNIFDSGGDCARSRVIGGFFTGNPTGTVGNNSSAAIVSPADAGTFVIDTSQNNNYFFLSCGNTGRVVGAPTEAVKGNEITIELLNNTGGAITTTWNAAFTLAGAWVDPAAGKRRTIKFEYNGTKWIELGRAAADI